MNKNILLSLCFASITVSGYCTEVQHLHADSPGTHRKHMETVMSVMPSKKSHQSTPTIHNKQPVEKEITEYTKLLEGVQQDNTPLGAVLKAHYSEHLVNLKKLLESDDTGKNVEGKLYQLHQTDSLFSRYY